MKLNGQDIFVSKYSEEIVEGEIIIFVEDYHRIVVLNPTAATIWKYIIDSYRKNTDICYNDIAEVLRNTFYISPPNPDELLNDIDDTISQLLQSALIIKEQDV